MNENVIIRSEPYNIKKICRTIMMVCLVIGIIWFYYEAELSYLIRLRALFIYILDVIKHDFWLTLAFFIPVAFGGLLCGLVALYGKTELVVSDKRIYGRAAFGKRVDLPLDSVSAIGMSIFKGISFGTSSGKIFFSMIKNRDDIHKAVSELIIQRQTKTSEPVAPEQKPVQSGTQELRELKKLLDDGIITQEEFDAKKKQLLGL